MSLIIFKGRLVINIASGVYLKNIFSIISANNLKEYNLSLL